MKGDPILGGRLRDARKGLKLTQLDVATDMGCDRSHISNVETGKHAPGRDLLMALAKRLDLSLDFLASAAHGDQKGAAAARDEGEAVLLYAYRELTPDQSDALLKVALGMARAGKPAT